MSREGPELCLRAPAKINLSLRVHAQRADGYHELSTVMLALGLADELRARRTRGPAIELKIEGPEASADIPTDERNLVWRALVALRDLALERGRRELGGISLTLVKHIPSQAGLGGGSSDAAAALRLAERLLELDGGPAWRQETLAGLGADCCFFDDLETSAVALCTGLGERVERWPVEPPTWFIALVVPRVACPTALVFQALECPSGVLRPTLERSDLGLSVEELRPKLSTDLEPAALRALPELRAWRSLLNESGASHFRLSGSGSAFFGLFTDRAGAAAQLREIEQGAASRGLGMRCCHLTRVHRADPSLP